MEFRNEHIWIFIGEVIPGLDEASRFVIRDHCGAVNIFQGVTRNHDSGQKVSSLFYDSYPEMALSELKKLAEDISGRFSCGAVAIFHKTGEVPVGEVSMITAVSCAHRKETLDATSELIRLLKENIPIWKKETFEDETRWKEENKFK